MSRFTGAPLRAMVVGLLSGGLLIPGAVLAAPALPGTLVGTVKCGVQDAPVANVSVAVEGATVTTHSTQGGKFVLTVPAGQAYTVDALTADGVASRYNVSVNPGETLDVGGLALQVCPTAAPAADSAAEVQGSQQEDMRDVGVDAPADN